MKRLDTAVCRSARRRVVQHGSRVSSLRGFTLIEVLLALVLLVAALTLAFTTLRAATVTARRGEALAQRNERMRAVSGFLRARLTGARPLEFGQDARSGLPQRFLGQAQRMRFVADLPHYLGHGGPYLHELYIDEDPDGTGLQLLLQLRIWQPDMEAAAADPLPPDVLADDLQAVQFRYRGLDAQRRLGNWGARWSNAAELPLLVEVTVRDANGRDWPPLRVALPLAPGSTTTHGGW